MQPSLVLDLFIAYQYYTMNDMTCKYNFNDINLNLIKNRIMKIYMKIYVEIYEIYKSQ